MNRFAAFAAGVAMTISGAVAVQQLSTSAAPGDVDTSFVPITPCRLIDTRPDNRVGPHDALGRSEIITVQAHGTNGRCTIPTDAVALSMNATGLRATANTFVTIWPGGTLPDASSLNQAVGQPATPNAVITPLSGGSFRAFNSMGSIELIIDINGYFTRSNLQDLHQRLSALESGGSGGGGGGTGFTATISGYSPGSTITGVAGTVTNSTANEADVRVDVSCPGGTLETDYVFDIPAGGTRGWEVLCDGSFTAGATVATVLF